MPKNVGKSIINSWSYNHIQESLFYSQVHSNCSLATYHVQEEAYQVSRMTIAIATKFWTFALSRRLPLMNWMTGHCPDSDCDWAGEWGSWNYKTIFFIFSCILIGI